MVGEGEGHVSMAFPAPLSLIGRTRCGGSYSWTMPGERDILRDVF